LDLEGSRDEELSFPKLVLISSLSVAVMLLKRGVCDNLAEDEG